MSIREIAHRTGVPSATISRVLNNSGYVKKEIRRKAFKAADEYNYVPSATARSLNIQDSLNVGTVIPNIEDEFFSKIIGRTGEVAEPYHYSIVFLGINETLEEEHDFLKTVEGQRLKGVVITPISETDTVIRGYLLRLEESGVSMVLVDHDVKGAQFGGISVDNQQGSCDEVMALTKAGHERITIITGPGVSEPGKNRYQGYPQVMEDSELSVPEEYTACSDFKIARTCECTGRPLGPREPPTIILTSNNLSILGCLKYLTEHKTRIGGDAFLMRLDGIDALWVINHRVFVVDRDVRGQGREAMGPLQECFEDSGRSRQRGRRIIIPCKVTLQSSEHRRTT